MGRVALLAGFSIPYEAQRSKSSNPTTTLKPSSLCNPLLNTGRLQPLPSSLLNPSPPSQRCGGWCCQTCRTSTTSPPA